MDSSDPNPVKLSNGEALPTSVEIRLHDPDDKQTKWKHPYETRHIEDFTLIQGEDLTIPVSSLLFRCIIHIIL